MLLTCKTNLLQYLQEACAVFLLDSVANQQTPVPHSLRPPIKLPQKNKNDYNELFISILAHIFPINFNINCYYAIKIIETIK
jgi:hypothetical protein